MTPMLLAELAAKSFVAAGGVLLLLALVGKRSAAERSWVAHAGLLVLLALPAAMILLPRWRLLAPREAASLDAGTTTIAAATPPAFDPGLLVIGLYGAGAAVLLLAAFVAVGRLFFLRREASVLIDASWLTALARAQRRMGVKSGAALLVSGVVTSPVSWGLMRPTIVINEALVETGGDAEAVIAHELAHVVRLDWAKLLVARVVVALFWFNPLVWALARQCHQLREEAADDAVLGAQVPGAEYAALLIEAARHECRGALMAAHGVAPGQGSLHRRVTRVLDAAARRTPPGAGWALGWLLGATVLAAPLAAATLERAEPAPKAAPAAAVTISAAPHDKAIPRPTVATTVHAEKPARPARAVTIQNTRTYKDAPASAPVAVTIRARKDEAARAADNARASDLQRAEERVRDKRAEAQDRARERQAEAAARQVEARKRQSEPRVRAETRTFTSVDGEARTLVKRSAEGTKSVSIAADGAVRMEKPGKTMVLRPVTTTAPLTKADIAGIEAEAASAVASTSATP
jgi:beta-lactamase regulating signal transducer with metallopeptidase domain